MNTKQGGISMKTITDLEQELEQQKRIRDASTGTTEKRANYTVA